MSVQRIARRYASALLLSATEAGMSETFERDFATILRHVDVSPDLRMLLRSPVIESWRKKRVFDEVFGPQVAPTTLGFFGLVADKGREAYLRDIIAEYNNLLDKRRGVVRAIITSAVELDEATRNKVVEGLAASTKRTVIATWKTDPAVLGGIVVRIGDTVLDGTIRHQLVELKERLRG